MGRLKGKALPQRLGPSVSRFRSSPASEAERTRRRDQEVAWRRWYKTARWQRLRAAVIKRDALTCQRTGVVLIGKHPAPDSPVVDHIRPHRGDATLFWDPDNLQTVSKRWHDSEKQRQERLGLE